MKIELLYFEGCPNHELAEDRLKQALQGEGMNINFQKINVKSLEMATLIGFCGSPSIRINGKDLEGRNDVSYFCRIYQNDGITEGAPSVDFIRRCIKSIGK